MISQTDKTIFSKLSLRARTTLEALLASGAAERAVQETEQSQLSKRTQLVAELEQKISRPPSTDLDNQSCDAFERLAKAEAGLREARAHYLSISTRAGHAHDIHAAEVRRLQQALIDCADPRLAEFITQLAFIRDAQLPGALTFWIDKARRDALAPIGSNVIEVERAGEAIKAAIEKTRALQLRAQSFVEIGQALSAMCSDLAAPLAALDLNPPSLTASEAEPGTPLRWGGRSRWVVEEHHAVKEPAAKQARKQRSPA